MTRKEAARLALLGIIGAAMWRAAALFLPGGGFPSGAAFAAVILWPPAAAVAWLLERLVSRWRGWRERMAGIFAWTLFYVLGMSAACLAAWLWDAARMALAP